MTTSAFPTYTLNDGLVAPQVGFGTYPLRGEDGIAAMLVRSIGTSNYTEAHLAEVIAATGVTPSVNQIELHPEFPQAGLRDVHERLGIRTEAWRTLARMKTVPEPVAAAAAAHVIEPGQVVLRWHLQLGVLPLPKSGDPVRQAQNLDVFDVELSEAEMAAITALGRPDGRLFAADPETHEEM